jgi:ATP-dependent RNA helicase DeaD
LEQLETESGMTLIDIAAALASLSQGSTPLLLAQKAERPADAFSPHRERDPRREETREPRRERPAVHQRPATQERPAAAERPAGREPSRERDSRRDEHPRKSGPAQMETFRIEVGSVHGIKPGNIVGAIANEADIEGVHIGRVDIREDHSYVDLPEGMPKEIFKQLQKVRVAGRELRISRVAEKPPKPPRATLGRHPGAVPREARPAKPKIAARRRAKD